MQDFGIGYVFKTKINNKVTINQLKQQNVNLFTYIINVNVKFAVSLPVYEPSETRKKFLKHVVLFVVL